MAHIVIENLFETTLLVNDMSKTLLQHVQDYRLDWMHACGGKGRCTTCKVIVKAGLENFEPLTIHEEKYTRLNALKPGERLACQAKIKGDIRIAVPEGSKFPHIQYSY